MRNSTKILLVAVALTATFALCAPTAHADAKNTTWNFEVKVKGSTSKVGNMNEEVSGDLAFADSSFLYADSLIATTLSGTFTQQTNGKLELVPDEVELHEYVAACVDLMLMNSGKAGIISSVDLTEVKSLSKEKKAELTFKLQVKYTVTGTVTGKPVVGANGRLTLQAKAKMVSLPGTEWATAGKGKISVSGFGTEQLEGPLYFEFGDGEVVATDGDGFGILGTYTVDYKKGTIDYYPSVADLQALLEVILTELASQEEEVITDISVSVTSVKTKGKFRKGEFSLDLKVKFDVYYKIGGVPGSSKGNMNFKAKGPQS